MYIIIPSTLVCIDFCTAIPISTIHFIQLFFFMLVVKAVVKLIQKQLSNGCTISSILTVVQLKTVKCRNLQCSLHKYLWSSTNPPCSKWPHTCDHIVKSANLSWVHYLEVTKLWLNSIHSCTNHCMLPHLTIVLDKNLFNFDIFLSVW